MTYPLFDRYPQLRQRLPVLHLCDAATPVEPWPGREGVFVKRDDFPDADFGGNKNRKLDFLLADARRRRRRDLLTFGYAGSNFVAATAWQAHKLGMRTTGMLLRQAPAPYCADNLAVGLHCGARLFQAPAEPPLVALTARELLRLSLTTGRKPYVIPPGGSSPLGTLGYVNAALELAVQVEAGAMPAPRAIYVPFSSMGTVAGLALGLRLAGLSDTRIQAVRVVGERYASRSKLARLIDRTLALLARLEIRCPWRMPVMDAVRVRDDQLGGGYGVATPAAERAIDCFESALDVRAEITYSGKALAALLADADGGRLSGPALFWHTFSRHRLPPGVTVPPRSRVPRSLAGYFAG